MAAKKKTSKKASESVGQPEINIGIVGHVDHGKTTLVQALSGKWAAQHSEELKRGITIRLGYADFAVYKCEKCPEPQAYSNTPECQECGKEAKLVRRLSIVDAPGHESLMATMLSGANIMDGALLMVAANEECPQPQTQEHLKALEVMGIDKLVVVQNKVDLVDNEGAQKNLDQIHAFLKGTPYENAPIIPISAQHMINVDALIAQIEETIPTPERDLSKDPLFFVARSFDVNKPGTEIPKLVGGVLGGALKEGTLKVGDELEILPGYEVTEHNQKVWKPLKTKVIGLMSGKDKIEEAHPGGTIAVLTDLDPSVVKSDKLSGANVGKHGQMPQVWYELTIKTELFNRVVGAKDELVVNPIIIGEPLMLNVSASATVGIVTEAPRGKIKVKLKRPVPAEKGARITISRNVGKRWRLIGYGLIEG
jgi:translation initiation factor 2 subunit 3